MSYLKDVSGPSLVVNFSGVVDGSVDWQGIGCFYLKNEADLTQPLGTHERSRAGYPTLDAYSRALVRLGHDDHALAATAGSNDWLATFRFTRGTSAIKAFEPKLREMVIPFAGDGDDQQVIECPLSDHFMKAASFYQSDDPILFGDGAVDGDDRCTVEMLVRPGNTGGTLGSGVMMTSVYGSIRFVCGGPRQPGRYNRGDLLS